MGAHPAPGCVFVSRQAGLGPEAGVLFGSSLRDNVTLTSLDMAENNIGTDGGKLMALALRQNVALTHLDLSRNGCGPNVFKYMGKTLQARPPANGPVPRARLSCADDLGPDCLSVLACACRRTAP